MKTTLGLAAVFAIGLWAGVSAYESLSFMGNIQAGFAILFGSNLLFSLWLWYRAEAGSGDAMVAPTLVLLSASMLLGVLPRVLWPAAERLHIAGSVVSVVVPTVLLIMQIRRRQKQGRSARPV